ncbi:MAG: DUF951 domain-containing protein [Chloroflexota bacterium]|nr:DUF951 domain-containing protein [Chloroflexota bacterium]
MAITIALGDRIRLKKPHPCGSDIWEVTRLGADIGLVCENCRRHVMVPRSKLESSIKTILTTESN